MRCSDEVLEGVQKLMELKPDNNKANPRIGVGALAFSSDSRYMYTKNGTYYAAYVTSCVR